MKPKYLEIKNAKYLNQFKVEFKFNDGKVVKVDFLPFLKSSKNPEIRKYLKENYFENFILRDGDVYWGDYELIFPIMDLYNNNILHGDLIDEAV